MTEMQMRRKLVELFEEGKDGAWNERTPVAVTIQRVLDKLSDLARDLRGAENGGSVEPQNAVPGP